MNILCAFVPVLGILLPHLFHPGDSSLHLPALAVVVNKDLTVHVPLKDKLGLSLTGLRDASVEILQGPLKGTELGGLFPTQEKTGVSQPQTQSESKLESQQEAEIWMLPKRAGKTGQKEAQKKLPKGGPSIKKRYLLKNTRIPAITPTRTRAATTQPMMKSPRLDSELVGSELGERADH
ncbi:hypothetical protein E2320_022917 [Naja naja]|nr:hypothetical protein E2320_022917 [Naja naja]